MNISLDLACVALACAMHNQDAVSRYEKSRAYGYESQGWKALEGADNDKRKITGHGLRGISGRAHAICKPRCQVYSALSGGAQ